MKTQNLHKDQQRTKYISCYHQKSPHSLTITKYPSAIQDKLFKQANYIWIVEDTPLTIRPQQIQQRTKLKIIFVKSVDDVKSQFQHLRNVILICHNSLFHKVTITLEKMLTILKIRSVVLYGSCQKNLFQQHKQRLTFIDNEQNVLKQISGSKKYCTGDFSNFILLNQQKHDSIILLKTIFAMLKQQGNVSQIIQQFRQLCLSCYKGQQYYIQKLYQQYLSSDYLSSNRAVQYYCQQTFLFKIVNRLLRISRDPTQLFIIQPYFKDLFNNNNIKQLYREQQQIGSSQSQKSYTNFVCFRGGVISEKEVRFMKQNINSQIMNLGFMSTSREHSVARQFIKNAFYVIIVNHNKRSPQLDNGFADINEYNIYGYEQQILVNPMNIFKILDFGYYDASQEIYKITLQYGRKEGSEQKNISDQRMSGKQLGEKSFRENQKSKGMMDALIQDGQNLEGSQEYSKKFMEIANHSKKLDLISEGHLLMTKVAANRRDHQKMAELFKNSQSLNPKCEPILKNLEIPQLDDKVISYF